MHDDSPGNDTFFASALDMLTCGLGATALLFILFSVVHVEPEKTSGVEEFINVRFEVSGLAARADLDPIVTPPSQEEIQFPAELFDQVSGRLAPTGAQLRVYQKQLAGLEAASPTTKGGGYTMVGFSLDQDQAGTLESGRGFGLHIRKPVAGKWKLSARFFNGNVRRGDKIHVRTTVMTRDARKTAEKDVTYMDTSSEIEVVIKP